MICIYTLCIAIHCLDAMLTRRYQWRFHKLYMKRASLSALLSSHRANVYFIILCELLSFVLVLLTSFTKDAFLQSFLANNIQIAENDWTYNLHNYFYCSSFVIFGFEIIRPTCSAAKKWMVLVRLYIRKHLKTNHHSLMLLIFDIQWNFVIVMYINWSMLMIILTYIFRQWITKSQERMTSLFTITAITKTLQNFLMISIFQCRRRFISLHEKGRTCWCSSIVLYGTLLNLTKL